jgi:two-component system, NtrC family, sensor kinase
MLPAMKHPSRFRLGIRGTLGFGLAGLMFAAGLIAAVVVVQVTAAEVEAQATRQFSARAAQLARMITLRCVGVPACGAALPAWLETAQAQEPDLLAVSVFGADLRPLAGEARAVDVAGAADVLHGGLVPAQRVLRDDSSRWGEGVDVRFAQPATVDGTRAVVSVIYDLAQVRADLDARLRWLLLALAFDFVAVVLFGLYVATRYLVRPVRALTAAADAIGPDAMDPTAIPVLAGPAELSRLADAYRAVVGRLANEQAALQASISALESTRDELVRSETLATVGRLAAGVAHEVGNPLAAVVGFVEFLRDAPEIDQTLRADLLGRTEHELRRMRVILRRLLDFSRPSESCAELVAPRMVADAAVELVRFHAALRHADLVVEGQALPVQVDPGRLKQVLVNLLLNAGEAFVDQRGRVVVHIEETPELVSITVTDDGPGVAAPDVPRLFEPFFTTRGDQDGTGLGLALAKQMVEEAGGRLRFVGTPGGPGAAFRVELPVPAALS